MNQQNESDMKAFEEIVLNEFYTEETADYYKSNPSPSPYFTPKMKKQLSWADARDFWARGINHARSQSKEREEELLEDLEWALSKVFGTQDVYDKVDELCRKYNLKEGL